MEKYFIFKFLIALLVLCMKNDKSEAEMDQVEFLWKEQNWQKMTWFTKVNTRKGLLDKNNLAAEKNTHERISKLKIITLLMGCGYGQKLIDFLWLTTYTVTDLSEDINYADKDCWEYLERCLKKAEYNINKLLLTFKQITSFYSRLKIEGIPFYDSMLAIQKFFNEFPSVHNGITKPEAMWFSRQIEASADFLGAILDTICVPNHSIIKKEELTNEYNNLTDEYKQRRNITAIHRFYVDKLDTAIEFIGEHLLYIGFHYSPENNVVTYTVPASSAAVYD